MLFTKASEYALLSLILISQKSSPVDVDTISNELKISKSFLAKILQNLAKEQILKSYKGANGGFALQADPQNISIKTIIECAEKREVSVFECSTSADGCPSAKASSCQIWLMFTGLQNKVDEMLDAIKLSDIIKK
ncbi:MULTISPECIES: RrF2 family transcriptional regulator [Campylobacter]|uniref:RrF2 family transcriptional regulator n=1 Tax=Campylobacter TaxID=194 RepID=UPI00027A352D|nr:MULTISPECIES: Rrf2 family transcriptional regulator [Campylobacter]EJP75554.1 transcriptional regulator [Campylobacter sp. FOBRC14]MBN7287696.1 Rrf2 family transcriptional regulator [Campylobacter curvus]MDU6826433.1 Rrf2 family transcriptional regulator [Campylobacter sp.]QKF61034.1 transcriptional regulator, IscR/Rrf2 family [Campylobacter curvus]UEB49352.1 Rrf2 family transcriptional regulator [Campylobacter curvus]